MQFYATKASNKSFSKKNPKSIMLNIQFAFYVVVVIIVVVVDVVVVIHHEVSDYNNLDLYSSYIYSLFAMLLLLLLLLILLLLLMLLLLMLLWLITMKFQTIIIWIYIASISTVCLLCCCCCCCCGYSTWCARTRIHCSRVSRIQ